MSNSELHKSINRNGTGFTLGQKRVLKATLAEAESAAAAGVVNAASTTALVAGGTSETVTAITGGGTTGLISSDATNVTITSANVNHQVSLPAAVDGKRLYIYVTATGCELISAVATDKLNNVVVGATNEGRLVATIYYSLRYTASTKNWIMTGTSDVGAVQSPVVPNAL